MQGGRSPDTKEKPLHPPYPPDCLRGREPCVDSHVGCKGNFTQNDMPAYDLEGNTELEAEVVDSFDVIGLVLVGRIAVVCSDVETKVSLIEREEGHA